MDQVNWSLGIELIFYFWMFIFFASNKQEDMNLICSGWLPLAFIFDFTWGKFMEVLPSVLVLEFAPFFYSRNFN